MKTKILCSLMAALMLFTTSSCEDNFDAKIYGELLQGKYPSTESEYVSYMMICYLPFTTPFTYTINEGTGMHGWYIATGGDIRFFDSTSDIMAPGYTRCGGEWLQLSKANYENCIHYWRGWVVDDSNPNHFMKTAEITRFTNIVDVLQNAPANVLSEETRDALLGEVRLCRGMMMYYLMHVFGPVPVIVDPEKVFDDEAQRNTTRPTLDEMCGYIYDDLLFAARHAPEVQTEKGRYTRDYARFCLMRHCLNEGSHMPGYYDMGLEMFSELEGKYHLFTQGDNPCADLYKNANKFNSEIIMAVSCDPLADGSPKHGNANILSMCTVPWDAAALDPNGNPTVFYPQNGGWQAFYNVAKKFYDSFETGDRRRDLIVTEWWNKSGEKVTANDLGTRWDGFICNKFPIETSGSFQGTDIPIARWADALLMYAELSVRKTNSAPSATAIDAVNQVRRRANLGELDAASTSSADNFLTAILAERGHELYYEGCRKIDLIRFNRYARETSKVKGEVPTRQYVPLPNYAVEAAAADGCKLDQFYSRPGWDVDYSQAQGM